MISLGQMPSGLCSPLSSYDPFVGSRFLGFRAHFQLIWSLAEFSSLLVNVQVLYCSDGYWLRIVIASRMQLNSERYGPVLASRLKVLS